MKNECFIILNEIQIIIELIQDLIDKLDFIKYGMEIRLLRLLKSEYKSIMMNLTTGYDSLTDKDIEDLNKLIKKSYKYLKALDEENKHEY